MRVYVFLKNGFEEVEALTITDYLRRAGIPVELVSFEKNLAVTGGHRINVLADKLSHEISITKDTAIFIPGGMLQMVSLQKDERAIAYIKEANKVNAFLIGICAATMVLEEAGVIKNRVVTSFPGFEDELKSIKKYSQKPVVRDANIITSRGPQTADDLAYYLIGLFKDETIKQKIKEDTLFGIENLGDEENNKQ